MTATASIETLYEANQRPLLAHLVRLVRDQATAEDLCHDTFVKALACWSQHDPTASARAWLYRIATNVAYDYLRRARRISFRPLLEADDYHGESPLMETLLETREAIAQALAVLPDGSRELLLAAGTGRDTYQIAADLGCSAGAVRVRLSRARAQVRRAYA